MEHKNAIAKLVEAIQTKNHQEILETVSSISQEDLKNILCEKYSGETLLQLAYRLGTYEVIMILLLRALSNSKRASLKKQPKESFDAEDRVNFWRKLFDLLDTLLTRGSQRVKANDLFKQLEPYLSGLPIDLCQLIDKPKYLLAALRSGADQGQKSEHSWLSKLMTTYTLKNYHKQQLLERLVNLKLLTKNLLPVKIWSKMVIEGTITHLDSLITPDIRDVDEQTGNNALHYAFKKDFPRSASTMHLYFTRTQKDGRAFVDLLLSPNKLGEIPLTYVIKNRQLTWWQRAPPEILQAFREIVLSKDVDNLRRIFNSQLFLRKNYSPALIINKTLLLLMHECGLRHQFLYDSGISNADIMLEIERLHISYHSSNDSMDGSKNDDSTFPFENLPSELAYDIASFLKPNEVVALFTITKGTTKLLRAKNQEKFWQTVNDQYFVPTYQWLGTSQKSRTIQASRASWNRKNQKFKPIIQPEIQNTIPLLMNENCLILEQNSGTLSNLIFWDCHSQEVIGESPKLPGAYSRFRPIKMLKQSNAKKIPTLIGQTYGGMHATAVFRNGALHTLQQYANLERSTVIDEKTILMKDGLLFDLEVEVYSTFLSTTSDWRIPHVSYNPFNRTVIVSSDDRECNMLVYDMHGKKVAEYERYIGNCLFYPIDEYTMLYNTFGKRSNRSDSNSLGHIDLRTGKDIVTIDGLLYCTTSGQPRIFTSERLLFYNSQTRLQTSWNVRQCRWEYVEETYAPCICANTRYSVHQANNKLLEIRDYYSL